MTDKEQKNEKPKIDPKTLSGLGGVKHDKPDTLKTDPKIVSYWLFNKEDTSVRQSSIGGNPTIFKVDEIFSFKENPIAHFAIYNHIRRLVEKHGTIKELWIEGHGGKLIMSNNHGIGFDVMDFLDTIDSVYGKFKGLPKMADRIVFDGCNTFEKLTDNEIKQIRKIADKYDIEIVGTTSPVADNRGKKGKDKFSSLFEDVHEFFGINLRVLDGRYVQFTPKGEVIRDKLDNRWNGINTIFEDRSWIEHHLNHTQTDGEKARKEQIKQEAEIKEFWLSRGKRGSSIKNFDSH